MTTKIKTKLKPLKKKPQQGYPTQSSGISSRRTVLKRFTISLLSITTFSTVLSGCKHNKQGNNSSFNEPLITQRIKRPPDRVRFAGKPTEPVLTNTRILESLQRCDDLYREQKFKNAQQHYTELLESYAHELSLSEKAFINNRLAKIVEILNVSQ